jgi:anti-sigma factor RsiW
LPIFYGGVALADKMNGETSMSECPWESRIAIAVADGLLPEDLVLHLAGCPVCREAHSLARKMRQFANGLAEEPAPSAASMWWRLNLRLRRERAREAEKPLVWMRRIFYVAIALTALLELRSIADLSGRTAVIGLVALSAVVLPVSIALLTWSRSKV